MNPPDDQLPVTCGRAPLLHWRWPLAWCFAAVLMFLLPGEFYEILLLSGRMARFMAPVLVRTAAPGAGPEVILRIVWGATITLFLGGTALLWLCRRWFRKRLRPLALTVTGLAGIAGVLYVRMFVAGIPVHREYSPDGRFYLQYYKVPELSSAGGFGQGSDFAGFMRLKTWWGWPLGTAPFDLYPGASPEWSPDEVVVRTYARWDYLGRVEVY